MIALTVLFLLLLLVVALTGASSAISSKPMRRLLGGTLLAVGILIMTGSGLCSAYIIVGGLSAGIQHGDSLTFLLVPMTIGGLPFAFGFGLFRWGRSLIRSTHPPSDDELRQRFD